MQSHESNSPNDVKLDVLDVKENEQPASAHHRIHPPLHLKFHNLNVKAGEKTILQNISGEFLPGELVAIMGPSGAGKSTLLNFLAGRARGMELESGEILINNKKATKALRRRIGYVIQEDVFFAHLTVYQTLKFVGEIRLGDNLTKAQKYKIVDEVIDDLGLRKCVDTVMGGGLFVTGCSGGEKKRCSIATELITNPSLLLMDEPTSGLDSSTAFNLINTLKKLAKDENCTIVTTIHQPSSHVFHMFDKLMLIVDGKVAYFGETAKVLDFFEFLGTPCYPNWNPADFIMEQVTMESDIKKTVADKFIQFQRSHSDKDQSNGYTEYQDVINIDNKAINSEETTENEIEIDGTTNDGNKIERWPTGYKTQVSALCKRSFIQSRKDMVDKFTITQNLCVSIIIGFLWLNTAYDEESIFDRRGLIFFVIVFLMLNPMFFALMTFPAERDAITKERASGMYRLSAYYTAKVLSECPPLLIQPIFFYTITYWMSGLNRSPVFLLGVLTIVTSVILAHTIGLVIGGAIKVFKKAITCTIIFALTSMILGGFYTNRIPHWLKWARYISHISYANNILVRLEFECATETFSCSDTESTFEICRNNGTHITGRDILPEITSIDVGIGESFAILWSVIIFFQILFYLVLKYANKPT